MSAPRKNTTPEPASSRIRSARWPKALWRPLGVDGVYGRTGAYEAIVEQARRLHLAGTGPACRGHALSAGDEPARS